MGDFPRQRKVGGKDVYGSGAELEIQSGATLDIQAGATVTDAAERDLTGKVSIGGNPLPASLTVAAAAGGANVSEVTITVLDGAGAAITTPALLDVWLSDDAQGEGLTSTTASGTVQAKSGEGTDLQTVTAKKYLRVLTKQGAGTYVLEITDSAKTAFYVSVANPMTGRVQTLLLATGDYGS